MRSFALNAETTSIIAAATAYMPTVSAQPSFASPLPMSWTMGRVQAWTMIVAIVAATKRTVATLVRSRPSSVITPPSEE